MITVTKIFEFDAAHLLPNHEGKCRRLHGHRWKLEITFSGTVKSNGMIVDFGKIKEIIKSDMIDELDHTFINEHPSGQFENPTAENMIFVFVPWINRIIQKHKKIFDSDNLKQDDIYLTKLKLWETPTSYATWRK